MGTTSLPVESVGTVCVSSDRAMMISPEKFRLRGETQSGLINICGIPWKYFQTGRTFNNRE
jgi:hypothetical protein